MKLIATDSAEVGAEAVKAVVMEFEALDPVLTLSQAKLKKSLFIEAVIRKDNREKNRVQLAAALGIPAHRITVKCRKMGGGLSGKERMEVALMAGVAAIKTGRPCRLVLSRDVAITGHRHDEHDGEGRMLQTKFDIEINVGHSVDLSEAWAGVSLRKIDGGYTLNNFEGQAASLHRNQVSSEYGNFLDILKTRLKAPSRVFLPSL